jgi:hypothetical protein
MPRTTIILTDEQRRGLTAMSDRSGIPIAEVIRRLIDAYFKGEIKPSSLPKPTA